MKRLRHPVRAIEEPFGKAGLIVAVIALVLALTGAAFAATGLNGKQKKEVEKIAKKFAGKPGANGVPGAQGPAGAAGANGKDGSNGTPGANGKSVVASAAPVGSGTGKCVSGGTKFEVEGSGTSSVVCNGQTGFTSTLPAGKTETGAFAVSDVATQANQKLSSPIAFTIPLAAAPMPKFIGSQEGAGEAAENLPEGCEGNVETPTAEEGFLCVYEAASGNRNVKTWLDVINTHFFSPQISIPNNAGTVGTVVVFGAEEEGIAEASGTWAVTAGP